MPNTTAPVGPVEPFDSPDDQTSSAALERRESEKVITDWEDETRRLGRALALMTLDFSAMTGPKWAHRFIISVGRVAEDCVLLFYGARFGALMELPANLGYSLPLMAHLPTRYVPVFAKGCMNAMLQGAPVRIQGTVDRENVLSKIVAPDGKEIRDRSKPICDHSCRRRFNHDSKFRKS